MSGPLSATTAFGFLKQRLVNAPILAYPTADGEFILDTDASNVGIGAVLSQVQDGTERVVAYGSRALSKPERNYCVTRRELLAIVHFTHYYRHYLYGSKFLVRTDHGSLRWLYNFREPEGQVARWIERLGCFDFSIEHRPGLKHGNADALSRHPCTQCGRINEPVSSAQETVAEGDGIGGSTTTAGGSCRLGNSELTNDRMAAPIWLGTGETELPYASRKTCYINALKRGRRRYQPPKDLSGTELNDELDRLKEGAGEWTTASWIDAQQNDSVIGKLLQWKESKSARPAWKEISDEPSELKYWWARWDSIELVGGLLYVCLLYTSPSPRDS